MLRAARAIHALKKHAAPCWAHTVFENVSKHRDSFSRPEIFGESGIFGQGPQVLEFQNSQRTYILQKAGGGGGGGGGSIKYIFNLKLGR